MEPAKCLSMAQQCDQYAEEAIDAGVKKIWKELSHSWRALAGLQRYDDTLQGLTSEAERQASSWIPVPSGWLLNR